jgi:cytochrome c peroxidase
MNRVLGKLTPLISVFAFLSCGSNDSAFLEIPESEQLERRRTTVAPQTPDYISDRYRPQGQSTPDESHEGDEHPHPSPSDASDPVHTVDAGTEPPIERGYDWQLPPGFPVPGVPENNPMTAEKVELGRHLFYDPRLSRNGTQSCAGCHEQRLAFTDGRATSVGSTGESTPRSSMSLANVAFATTLTWGHPYLEPLERQALVPIFGDAPVELGQRSQAELEERLTAVPRYRELFARAFPTEATPVTLLNLTRALACFERTLVSGTSPFDDWLYGDANALSSAAERGFQLFNSERLECFHCHVGFNFTDHVRSAGTPLFSAPFHNTALYNIDGAGAYPEPNTGVFSVSLNPADMGKFKAPTLRNIALTAPYMHDGSIATLSEVLDHYAAGGRTIAAGENAGVGSESPFRSNLIRGFTLSTNDREDLLAFFESLTDPTFLNRPDFSNPWTSQ